MPVSSKSTALSCWLLAQLRAESSGLVSVCTVYFSYSNAVAKMYASDDSPVGSTSNKHNQCIASFFCPPANTLAYVISALKFLQAISVLNAVFSLNLS